MTSLTDEQREILNNLYYDPKTGYTGVEQLSRRSELPKKTVKDYLLEQPVYTKHKPAKQKFQTRRVVVHGLDHQFQAD